MNVTAWASGLEVTGDGTGIVSHAGVGLLRRLCGQDGPDQGPVAGAVQRSAGPS